MSIWGHTCNTAWNLGTSIVTKILTNCWEGERSNKAIGKKGSNDEERLGKKTKLTAISVTMLEDDWWETQLSLKGAWTSKRDRVRIVKMVQEGITKSDGVKLSKRKFKLNLRKNHYWNILGCWVIAHGEECKLQPIDCLAWEKDFQGMQFQESEVHTFLQCLTA